MSETKPNQPSLIPSLQADALAREIELQLQTESRAMIAAAQRDARAAIAQARATARKRLHDAIAELRREGERRLTRAKAELETAARAQQQKQAARALDTALPLLREALAARWRGAEARQAWTAAIAKLCAARLRHGAWTVEHPANWSTSERNGFTASLGSGNDIAVTFAVDDKLSAGLRIKADQAVLDGAVQGLLSDDRTIAAILLDELDSGTEK